MLQSLHFFGGRLELFSTWNNQGADPRRDVAALSRMAWIPRACPGECPKIYRGSSLSKLGLPKKLEGKISMPVYCNQDDSREFEEIFWGFVTQFLTFHAGHWCKVN